MNHNQIVNILESWKMSEGNVTTNKEILDWVKQVNHSVSVSVKETSIYESTFWFYDDYDGEILNRKRSFFSITGMRLFKNHELLKEQPIIIQPEIGYLGIICKMIDGVMNFLIQAKIEPGNVNYVQLSPTIQATKSNFERAHGGELPKYFNYFENSGRYHVIYDQIQSEQGSRFYRKRNRNIIIEIEEDIELYSNFKWMTLGQIKQMMKIDNLVNMDTRTVISGIPLLQINVTQKELDKYKTYFTNDSFYKTIFEKNPLDELPIIYQYINNYKMFNEITATPIPLHQLVDWNINEFGVFPKKTADFDIRFFDISISGREVQNWTQPLFKAIGSAFFGLLSAEFDGVMKFLVKFANEIGTFDKLEIGPTIQMESLENGKARSIAELFFFKKMKDDKNVLVDVIMSEEGGRFYHEQNRNVILHVDSEHIPEFTEDYLWVDYATLNYLVQVNNCLNIQLRNLLSLLDL